MKHFTDDEIRRFWMGGPPDEATYLNQVKHLYDCAVCRERTWQFLVEIRSQMNNLFGGLIAKLESSSAEAMSKMSLNQNSAADTIREAVKRIMANPLKEDWTSEALFDSDALDSYEHLADCDGCYKNFALLSAGVTRAVEAAKVTKISDNEKVALTKLDEWFRDGLEKVDILRANPNVTVRVEGHADERGSTEYNLALASRRADAVKTFFTGFGLDADRFPTVSYGEERPLVNRSDEAAWAQNRRAEFVITGGGGALTPPR